MEAAIAMIADVHHPPTDRTVPVQDVEFPEGEISVRRPVVSHAAELRDQGPANDSRNQFRGYVRNAPISSPLPDRWAEKRPISAENRGTGAIAPVEVQVPPGGGPPPHIHRREDEAFYVLEGELLFHVDGRSIAVGAGFWVTLARGSLHHFKNVGNRTARMLILVTPSGLERFFEEVGRTADDDGDE